MVSCTVGRFFTNRAITVTLMYVQRRGFTGGSDGKESVCNVGDPGSIPGVGISPGEGDGYPLQYSGLENSMDCVVHGVAKSQTRLSNFQFHKAGREGKRGKHVSSGISSYKDTSPVRSGSQLYDLILP